MAKKKPIYNVTVKVDAEVSISIAADNAKDALDLAAEMNARDIIKPADGSCDMVDWNNLGVMNVSAEGYVPFKQ